MFVYTRGRMSIRRFKIRRVIIIAYYNKETLRKETVQSQFTCEFNLTIILYGSILSGGEAAIVRGIGNFVGNWHERCDAFQKRNHYQYRFSKIKNWVT